MLSAAVAAPAVTILPSRLHEADVAGQLLDAEAFTPFPELNEASLEKAMVEISKFGGIRKILIPGLRTIAGDYGKLPQQWTKVFCLHSEGIALTSSAHPDASTV